MGPASTRVSFPAALLITPGRLHYRRAHASHPRAASLCEARWHACLADGRACCTLVARFCAASRRRLLLKGLQQLNAAVLHASEAGSPDGNSCAEAGPRQPRRGKRGRDLCDEDGMESADDARIELIGRWTARPINRRSSAAPRSTLRTQLVSPQPVWCRFDRWLMHSDAVSRTRTTQCCATAGALNCASVCRLSGSDESVSAASPAPPLT